MRVEQPFDANCNKWNFGYFRILSTPYLCIVLSRKFVFIANGLITYGIASSAPGVYYVAIWI